jgi:hypothetical protein
LGVIILLSFHQKLFHKADQRTLQAKVNSSMCSSKNFFEEQQKIAASLSYARVVKLATHASRVSTNLLKVGGLEDLTTPCIRYKGMCNLDDRGV